MELQDLKQNGVGHDAGSYQSASRASTEDALPNTLARQLKAWCAANGRSMRWLSLELGRGEKYIADIVAGHSRNPEPATLARLAEITGLNLMPIATADARGKVRTGLYLDQVLALVEASDLPAKAAIARDLRLVCRDWLKRKPDTVPADPRWLKRHLEDWNGSRCGVSKKRFANVKSHLNRALELAGAVVVDRKPVLSLGPVWRPLWDALPVKEVVDSTSGRPARGHGGKPKLQKTWIAAPLSRLMRYCDREGIAPTEVDAAVLEAYACEREKLALSRFGAKKRRELRSAWNEACATVPGWPQRPIAAPEQPRLNLSLEAFPPSFADDLALYREERGCRGSKALESARRLDRARALYRRRRPSALETRPGRLAGRLAPRTVEEHLATLRLAASVLVRHGIRRPEEIVSISGIADVGTASVVVDDVEARLGLRSSYAGNLVKNLCSVALRWRNDLSPEELDDFAGLRAEAEQELEKGVMSDRDRKRLAVFMDPSMMGRLVTLPRRIIERAERIRRRGGPIDRALALQVQGAVICIIEQTVVPRIGTLARTHLDRHIVWPHRKNGPGHLSYGGADTKTGQPLSAPLAPWKMRILELYCQHYRPVLACGPDDRWLFPGDSAEGGKTRGALAAQCRELLFAHLGVRINFHLWRKIMASWLLRETRNPEMVAGLLGHVDGSTVTKLYAEFQAAWAVEELDRTIERLLADRLGKQPGHARRMWR